MDYEFIMCLMGYPADLREQILEQLKSILNVFLFGSWARQKEKRSSDIDVAIESDSQISPFCGLTS